LLAVATVLLRAILILSIVLQAGAEGRRFEARLLVSAEILVIGILGFSLLARGIEPLRLRLGGRQNAEIVFGVLEIVLGHHRIAGRMGVSRQLHILFGNMGGIAAHLYVRTVALIVPRQRIHMFAAAIVVVTAALPVFVVIVILLSWSHLVL